LKPTDRGRKLGVRTFAWQSSIQLSLTLPPKLASTALH